MKAWCPQILVCFIHNFMIVLKYYHAASKAPDLLILELPDTYLHDTFPEFPYKLPSLSENASVICH